jgi:hypothetical protein
MRNTVVGGKPGRQRAIAYLFDAGDADVLR